jgi:hypothetical protein
LSKRVGKMLYQHLLQTKRALPHWKRYWKIRFAMLRKSFKGYCQNVWKSWFWQTSIAFDPNSKDSILQKAWRKSYWIRHADLYKEIMQFTKHSIIRTWLIKRKSLMKKRTPEVLNTFLNL